MGNFDYFGKLLRRGWLLLTQYRLLAVLGFIFALSSELSARVMPGSAADEVMSAGEIAWLCLALVLALFFFLIGIVAYLGLIAATDQIVTMGRSPSLSVALRLGRANLGRLFRFILLTMLVIFLFLLPLIVIPATLNPVLMPLLLLIPGVLLGLGICALVIDHQGAAAAVRIAWQIVRTAPVPVLLTAVLTSLTSYLITGLSALLTLGVTALDLPDLLESLLLTLLLAAATSPIYTYSTIVWPLLYRDQCPALPVAVAPPAGDVATQPLV